MMQIVHTMNVSFVEEQLLLVNVNAIVKHFRFFGRYYIQILDYVISSLVFRHYILDIYVYIYWKFLKILKTTLF